MLPQHMRDVTTDRWKVSAYRVRKNLSAEQRAEGVRKHGVPEHGLTADEVDFILANSLNEMHAAQRFFEHVVDGKPFDLRQQNALPADLDAMIRERVESEVAKRQSQITEKEREEIEDAAYARILRQFDERERLQSDQGFKERPLRVGHKTKTEMDLIKRRVSIERAKELGWENPEEIKWNGGLMRRLDLQWARHTKKKQTEQLAMSERPQGNVGDTPETALAELTQK